MAGARRSGERASLGSSRGLRAGLLSLGGLVPFVLGLLPLDSEAFFLGLCVCRG